MRPMIIVGQETAISCFARHRSRADVGACRRQFDQWRREVEASGWKNFGEVKTKYRSADQVGGRVVFNISGNNYRLVVVINYAAQVVAIRFMGTHSEYDKIDAETV